MNKFPIIALCLLLATTAITACDGGGSFGQRLPQAPTNVTVDAGLKQFIFSWTAVPGATHYHLFENPDGHSGFTQAGADIPAGTLSVTLNISVHLHDFANALYFVQACNSMGCTSSTEISAMNVMLGTIGYFKASNTATEDEYGRAVALSADGNTLAVGARVKDAIAGQSGAVYLFRFDGADWFQQAYVKASNIGAFDLFGSTVALSADGNTLTVGAPGEASNTSGIGSDQSDNSAPGSGAVYLFRFDGTDWFQQAYVKASNTEKGDQFGEAVALSADGNTLAVGAPFEDSAATGINGDQHDDSFDTGRPADSGPNASSGVVYLFRFDGSDWSQEAYVKASNTEAFEHFGDDVSLSADGSIMAVGAHTEDGGEPGINGDQNDNSAVGSGAVYMFQYDGSNWSQQAYIKASNPENEDSFGRRLDLSADGRTLAVSAYFEDSAATGINGSQSDNAADHAGAVYVIRFDGSDWSQEAYIKASNTDANDNFGRSIALSADGTTLAVGANREASHSAGVGGDQNDNSVPQSGAVYIFHHDTTNWLQESYVKASNPETMDDFGFSVAMSEDGSILAVGAQREDSAATGISGNQSNNASKDAGAVYLY